MVRQNRKTRRLGRFAALALLAGFAAGSASAMLPDDKPRRQREARRLGQIQGMDIYVQNYGASDWSRVTSDLFAHPGAAGNPAVMSIPLSLGNVYLNRFEARHDSTNLERAIQMFERVTALYALWAGREGSGSVVSYLDISLSRLDAECDVGRLQPRIDALWQAARAITAAEAEAASGFRIAESILPVVGEEDASRASLFAAAGNFLADDSRARIWQESARQAASLFSPSACQTQETMLVLSQGALAYQLVGHGDPLEFEAILHGASQTSADCPQLRLEYETTGPVAAVAPGASLGLAIRDSRIVAYRLGVYLKQFPPGSQCSGDDEGDGFVVDFRP